MTIEPPPLASAALRASHRQTGPVPYDTGGVPWQTHVRADATPLRPGAPVPLDLAFSATAYARQPGDMLRLSVTTRSPRSAAGTGAEISIISDAGHPSWIEVPDVDTRDNAIDPDLSRGPTGISPDLIGSTRQIHLRSASQRP